MQPYLQDLIGQKASLALCAEVASGYELQRMDVRALKAIPGIGPILARRIRAALDLGIACVGESRKRGARIRSAQDAYALLEPELRHAQSEQFKAILLDSKLRVIGLADIAKGGPASCAVDPSEVFRSCLRASARALIVAHNHPSGDPEPSREDIELTNRLSKGAEALGIRLLDHVIIGDGSHVSLADRGLL